MDDTPQLRLIGVGLRIAVSSWRKARGEGAPSNAMARC
jgi:hypothetical protein